jgi:hypothetical protein
VDQPVRALTGRLGVEVGVERRDQPLADGAVLRCDRIAVAVGEAGPQLGDQRLVHR